MVGGRECGFEAGVDGADVPAAAADDDGGGLRGERPHRPRHHRLPQTPRIPHARLPQAASPNLLCPASEVPMT